MVPGDGDDALQKNTLGTTGEEESSTYIELDWKRESARSIHISQCIRSLSIKGGLSAKAQSQTVDKVQLSEHGVLHFGVSRAPIVNRTADLALGNSRKTPLY